MTYTEKIRKLYKVGGIAEEMVGVRSDKHKRGKYGRDEKTFVNQKCGDRYKVVI